MRWLLLLLLFPQLVFAATVTGTVYDLSLEPVTDIILTVDTVPEQRVVVKDGTYAVTIPEGTYTIDGQVVLEGFTWSVLEEVTVEGEGEYVLDLILEPSFDDLENLTFGEELPDLTVPEEESSLWWLIIVGIVCLLFLGWFWMKMMSLRAPPKIEDDEYRQAVLQVLKKHKGRIMQRQLRREMPFSEAKVSLVLSELEHEGKITKIKKGRGNIISLKR